MKDSVQKIFYSQILFFFLIVFGISVTGLYLIEKENIQKLVISTFDYELELAANKIDFQIKIYEENVKALSSRTMIRKELYKWHNGEITLDNIRNYTEKKYTEGAAVYDNILFAIRVDDKNNQIASYNPNLILSDCQNIQDLEIAMSGRDYHVFIKNDIIHEGINIGYDFAAFTINDLQETGYQSLIKLTVLKSPKENLIINSYARSIEIGGTGFFLYAELSQDVISEGVKRSFKIIILHAILLIALLILVSYFTILKLVNRLLKELKEKNKRIIQQEKFSAFGQISGGIAHNFNNILMSIVGYSELLQLDKEVPERLKKGLKIIFESSMRASAIIKKLLDFNRNGYIQFSKIDIIDLLKQFIKKNEYNQYITITMEDNYPDESFMIKTEENSFRDIIENLVKNSIEANSSKIEIKAYNCENPQDSTCSVCSLPVKGKWFCISLKDNGDGISDKMSIERLFEPFFSLKGVGFSGLGLSQVSGIVKLHGGHIQAVRNSDGGTVINIYLPTE